MKLTKNLKEILKNNELTVGSWLSIPSPVVAEIMAQAGFPWLVIDLEHSVIDYETMQTMIIAIENNGIIPLVRVSSKDSMQIKKVLDAGLTVFKFSIDALDDEWQKKIRGSQNNFNASYETILEIINLKKERGYKTLLVPTMIALSEDVASRQMHSEFMELWKDKDVFAYVKSQDNRWLLEQDEEMENRSHYETQYCEYPWTSLTVMADGSIVPCTQDYDTEMVLGNVNEKTLEEIWNDTPFEELRRMHITGDFPKGHKCQERCDVKKLYQFLK